LGEKGGGGDLIKTEKAAFISPRSPAGKRTYKKKRESSKKDRGASSVTVEEEEKGKNLGGRGVTTH